MGRRWYFYCLLACIILILIKNIQTRLRLSRAKHPSLAGHSRISRYVAKLVPFYEYNEDRFFTSDGAPPNIADKRRAALDRLATRFRESSPRSTALSEQLENSVSDVLFTNAYRVPFQYRNFLRNKLKFGILVDTSSGTKLKDIDGNWSYDLSGSYGVNVFGYDFYKDCIDKGFARVRDLGPVLGPYHPIIVENVSRLKAVSGLDEVSFHMSGTEAVMQAVRLARYHTGRSHLVRFCGSYHGWWDGVQPGIGNLRKIDDVYTLKEMDKNTITVLRTRRDIACVLVNPLQAMNPNASAPSDAMLVNSGRSAHFDRQAYSRWLKELRQVCSEHGIVLIMDEVFLGFRIAYGGAQEYFGVKADMVTCGKTLGGGSPIGVVCGKHKFMKRFKDNRPTDICFARGTFNSHPYVMGAMNEFLHRIDQPEIRASYEKPDELWDNRVMELNSRMESEDLPVRVVNFTSVWTILYTRPSRYNWMFQYYLRAAGLALSWTGSGRIIMSHNFSDADYDAVMQRFVAAAQAMNNDGWWWQRAGLTNSSIKKQVFRELLASYF